MTTDGGERRDNARFGGAALLDDLLVHPLRLSGLVLTLVDSAADIWALQRTSSGATLSYLAGASGQVLAGGFVVPGRRSDVAVAIGRLPEGSADLEVRFTCQRLRWRVEQTVAVSPVSAHVWVAEAVGDFDLAVLEVDGEPLTTIPLNVLH